MNVEYCQQFLCEILLYHSIEFEREIKKRLEIRKLELRRFEIEQQKKNS